MSINKYKNCLIIYPEDEATKNLADAFLNHQDINRINIKIMHAFNDKGGWKNAISSALNDIVLQKNGNAKVLILIDLDKDANRINDIKEKISETKYKNNIFIIGWKGNAEKLKSGLSCQGKGFNKLGELLAEDAINNDCLNYWQTEYFSQIKEELPKLKMELLNLVMY